MHLTAHPDEPYSHAYGSIVDGVFDGKIHSKEGVFYVEKASKFPHHLKNSTRNVHSVIYKEENVVDPYEDRRSGTFYVLRTTSVCMKESCLV